MKTNDYTLGIDIGITSVGWGIVDKDGFAVTSGVRLFDEQSGDKKIQNLTRREKRGSRRNKRRRTQRLKDMRSFLLRSGLIDEDFKQLDTPYQIRAKGLKEKLSKNELGTALLHITKKRGSILDVSDVSEEAMKLKGTLSNNSKELRERNMYVCEIQLERLSKQEPIRGLDNVFHTDDYVAEATRILDTQNISNEYQTKIIEIIKRRRHYSHGPGSFESPTPYGRFRIDKNNEVYEVDLIEEMRGKCSLLEAKRAPKMSLTAELFNYLNDLNNLTINENYKLTTEQKDDIISIILRDGTLRKTNEFLGLCKYLNVKQDAITGCRKTGAGKGEISSLKGYLKVLPLFKKYKLENTLSVGLMDEIAEILTICSLVDERIERLSELIDKTDLVDELVNLTGFRDFHSLSIEAMEMIIPEMMSSNKNQMQVIQDLKLDKYKKNKQNNLEFNDDVPISPSAQRAQKQALLVIERLQKEFGYFDSIVIETTRDKKTIEQKRDEEKRQNKLRKENEEIKKELLGSDSSKRLKGKQIIKYKLYKEQNGKCAYTGHPLNLDLIKDQKDEYEVDHIIPYSISLDNSLSNKVLVEKQANQRKGNLTPFQYFTSGKAYGEMRNFDDFSDYVKLTYQGRSKEKKRSNLLFKEDINRFDNQLGFINRNLVDTSYAVKRVLTVLQNYYKSNEIPTNVKTMKGKVTGLYRSVGGHEYMRKHKSATENPLHKNRDEHRHHAFDALIIARISQQNLIRHMYDIHESKVIDYETGEITYDTPFADRELKTFIANLAQIKDDDIRFSWKIDSKPNRRFSDETIYSTKIVDGEEKIVNKINDIYALKSSEIKKKIIEGKDNLLVFKNDIKTYEILVKAYEQFSHTNYPFKEFFDQYGYVRKYSKKGNGPIVKQLKYFDTKLGNYIDISHKYTTNKRVILRQLSSYRADIYQEPNGHYKFVTIRNHDLKPSGIHFFIDENEYKKKKEMKKISSDAQFKFSLYRNDTIYLKYKNEASKNNGYFRFIGVNSDAKNLFEVKKINSISMDRIKPPISKTLVKFEKYNVSPTGQYKKVHNEQLKFKM